MLCKVTLKNSVCDFTSHNYTCDMTHLYVWHIWIYLCGRKGLGATNGSAPSDTQKQCVWRDIFSWLIYNIGVSEKDWVLQMVLHKVTLKNNVCDMTYLHVWHDSSICVAKKAMVLQMVQHKVWGGYD